MTWTSQAQGVKFGRRSPLNRGQHCTPFHTGLPFLEMRDELKGKDLDAIFYDGWHLDVPGHALYGKILARTLAQMIQSSR